MPAIWSSSERPISVPMVWVDGIRHAILSDDDPVLYAKTLQRRPYTTLSVKDKNDSLKLEPRMSITSTKNNFDACFIKLCFPVEKINKTSSQGLIRLQSAPNCTRDARNILHCCTKKSSESKNKNTQVLYPNVFTSNMDKEVSFNLEKKIKHLEVPRSNTLLERVIQWLDLSGEAHNYELEDPLQRIVNTLNKNKIKSRFKSDVLNRTCMKIILPIQYFILQEKRIESETDVRIKKNLKNKKSTTKVMQVRKMITGIKKNEELCKLNSKEKDYEFEGNSAKLSSTWSPPEKTQLHIFVPSLRSEFQWMSSQESLLYE